MANNGKVAVVSIVKNESRFIEEWLAHYLSLGVDQIIIYDNESDDDTAEIIKRCAEEFPIKYHFWPNAANVSPQISAYRDALKRFGSEFEWVGFFDADEMLVIRNGERSISAVLSGYGEDVSAVAVNWLTFGTSGVRGVDYGLVRTTFRFGPNRNFGNNRHFKSFVRPERVQEMHIHHAGLTDGRYIHPDGSDMTMPDRPGLSEKADHSILQLNHYQTKSHDDFWAKIRKGRVCKRPGDPLKIRADPEKMFAKLDRKDSVYVDIEFNKREFMASYSRIKSINPVAEQDVVDSPELKTMTVNGVDIRYRDNGTDIRVINSSLIKSEFKPLAGVVSSSPNRFIIDAGGYIGTSAILLAQMFPDATIVVIEPSTANFSVLQLNVANFDNIVPLNAALVGTARDLDLFDRRTGSWGFTIVEKPDDKEHVESIGSVRGLTIAELMASFDVKGVDVLKVDIEGGEAELFQSSAGWISSVGAIVIELHDRIVPGCTAIFDKASSDMKVLASSGEKRMVYNQAYFA